MWFSWLGALRDHDFRLSRLSATPFRYASSVELVACLATFETAGYGDL